jgi:hypothetical protein
MARTVCEEPKTSRQVSLYLGASGQAAWENVLLPWFESVAPHAFENQEPVAVVAPLGSDSAFLREQLLKHRVSLLGMKFLSPPSLREMLLRDSDANLPLREHLRLLLSIAAEECAAGAGESEQTEGNVDLAKIAKSVARAPDHLLRAIDQLSAAGWTLDDVGPSALRQIVAKFQNLVRKCGFQMVHQADRAAAAAALTNAPRFSNLLVTDFNAAHWPLWPLLRAAVASARKATVILTDPRDEARDLDETWVGTWEETFGAAQPIAADTERSTPSLAELTRLPETPLEVKARAAHPISNVQFLVGRNVTEQAKAIVALTGQFLSEKSRERIGILFPGPSALHRLVAALLEQTKIPHNDGIGHPTPNPLDGADWRAWLELQENPRLNILLRFLRTLENGENVFADLPFGDIEKTLRRAYDDVLIDDIHVLREYCARQTDHKLSARVAHGLNALQFLPERNTMSNLLLESRKIFDQFGWTERWSEVDRLSRNWNGVISERVSRRTYLRWLAEIICASAIDRDECGNHSYSRVQLLRYAAAEGQDWPHLIFAGLNEGEWPPRDDESGFIRAEEIADLNRSIQRLNRSAIRQGRHGEGQWSVEEGKTFYLGAAEQGEIAQRQFFNLIESAGEKIGITANLFQDSAPERTWNPSDFFSRLYFAARGKAASQEVMHTLEARTRAWLNQSEFFFEKDSVGSIDIAQTRVAYDARRRPGRSSEYEFALLKPPERAVSLRVTDWEHALKSPAGVWMKIFLGVEADDESGDGWSRSTGQWVHRWLAQSAGASGRNQFVELLSASVIRGRLFDAAHQFRSDVQHLCEACGRSLPDWWSSGWSNALYVADCLAAHLAGLEEDWSHLTTEWQLASPEIISLGHKKNLRVRGRIDLILARGQPNASIGFDDLWVIDYKTGRKRGFNLRELRRNESPEQKLLKQLVAGRGVQLGLYALAVHALGASNVRLTLLAPAGEVEPQFDLDHVTAQKDFWCELYHMQETGVFGMLEAVRPEYGFAPAYPLATLAVDFDLLKEKWRVTHPAFAVAENGGAEP